MTDDESWEARMAARARERAEKRHIVDTTLPNPPAWLNGQHELSDPTTLWIWPAQYCICCGATKGVTCFVMTDDYEAPLMPDWPFSRENCPLCRTQPNWSDTFDRSEVGRAGTQP